MRYSVCSYFCRLHLRTQRLFGDLLVFLVNSNTNNLILVLAFIPCRFAFNHTFIFFIINLRIIFVKIEFISKFVNNKHKITDTPFILQENQEHKYPCLFK